MNQYKPLFLLERIFAMQEIPAIMTRKEASELLHISKNSILKLIHDGKIDAFMIGNGYRITRTAIEDFINNSLYSHA